VPHEVPEVALRQHWLLATVARLDYVQCSRPKSNIYSSAETVVVAKSSFGEKIESNQAANI